ncbi:MAG TPA: sporulation protein YabP [Firmicutes bacterium]|jgi:sporulation protein YabP|nr:sporulation protein YabP [Bacillota bacterium]
MDEQKLHQLTIFARERMEINGVTNVGSFNREEVLLETEQGGLVIRGSDLHLRQLHVEKGKLMINGKIDSVKYSDETVDKTRRVWSKLFK